MLTPEERQRIEDEERKRIAEEQFRAEVRAKLQGDSAPPGEETSRSAAMDHRPSPPRLSSARLS